MFEDCSYNALLKETINLKYSPVDFSVKNSTMKSSSVKNDFKNISIQNRLQSCTYGGTFFKKA